MYLRFKKDHPIGIKENTCLFTPKGKTYIEEGYAEEITQEEFEASKGKKSKTKAKVLGNSDASQEDGANSTTNSKDGLKSQKITGKKKNKNKKKKKK